MVQYSFTSTETRRLVRSESPGRPHRLSHSSWTMSFPLPEQARLKSFTDFRHKRCVRKYWWTGERVMGRSSLRVFVWALIIDVHGPNEYSSQHNHSVPLNAICDLFWFYRSLWMFDCLVVLVILRRIKTLPSVYMIKKKKKKKKKDSGRSVMTEKKSIGV